MTQEIFNHDRIQIDEMIDKFGPERFLREVKSIFEEKATDKRRVVEEREALQNAFKGSGVDVSNVDQAVAALFDYHGGAAVLQALIDKVERLAEDWQDADMKKQVAALRLKSVQKAWGLS